jgi:hypothetical protein
MAPKEPTKPIRIAASTAKKLDTMGKELEALGTKNASYTQIIEYMFHKLEKKK